jgi:hypothetical protein
MHLKEPVLDNVVSFAGRLRGAQTGNRAGDSTSDVPLKYPTNLLWARLANAHRTSNSVRSLLARTCAFASRTRHRPRNIPEIEMGRIIGCAGCIVRCGAYCM